MRPLLKSNLKLFLVNPFQKLSGGTTVSGTIIAAVKAGISVFATGLLFPQQPTFLCLSCFHCLNASLRLLAAGGLGGVHRGAETTFDVSADLKELGRNSICVVSAGVKSILDIGKTLEYMVRAALCV